MGRGGQGKGAGNPPTGQTSGSRRGSLFSVVFLGGPVKPPRFAPDLHV